MQQYHALVISPHGMSMIRFAIQFSRYVTVSSSVCRVSPDRRNVPEESKTESSPRNAAALEYP